jgi:ABC-2 type transport system permease protein
MSRWLRIARAEAVRDFSTALRYPLELLSGVVIMYVFFIGIVTGGRAIAGAQAVGAKSLEQMVIAFCMWFLALMALNAMSVDLEGEARQGTLEQIFLNAPSFLGLVWIRGYVHVLLGGMAVVVLAILIQLTTGKWMHFAPADAGMALLALLLTVTELLGFGLILGGLTLVFKRLGQVSAILQFALFFIVVKDLSQLSPTLRTLVVHAPLAAGVNVVKLLNNGDTAGAMAAYIPLVIDAVLYAAIGSVFFLWCQREALKRGSLSHY